MWLLKYWINFSWNKMTACLILYIFVEFPSFWSSPLFVWLKIFALMICLARFELVSMMLYDFVFKKCGSKNALVRELCQGVIAKCGFDDRDKTWHVKFKIFFEIKQFWLHITCGYNLMIGSIHDSLTYDFEVVGLNNDN